MPAGVRYVITLDADTRLPRGAARRLVGKMAHPLNRPRLDPAAGRVVEGYAVLQPRVTPSLPIGREGSLFQRVFSGPGGIDPYAFAVSDVYQDLFGEGSYTGKGIYDVDAFEAALAGRIPENTLLSHDLLEGIFARRRAGLGHRGRRGVSRRATTSPRRGSIAGRAATGSCCPGSSAAAGRAAIAARGDPADRPLEDDRQPAPHAARRRPPSSRWSRAGRCRSRCRRRSGAAFVARDARDPRPAARSSPGSLPRRLGISKRSHLRAVGGDLALALVRRSASWSTLLAHQAWLMTDAIVRTLLRLFVRGGACSSG